MRLALRVFGRVARNGALGRVVTAYALFILTEYAVWIAMLVYAYGNGGATTAGLVALAQLLPAAAIAPFASTVSDRRSPVRLLVGGYVLQAVGTAATAVAIFLDAAPYLAYLGAVLAAVAVSTTRPAQAALVPSLTRDVEELTAANVLLGWLESLGIVFAGVGTGLILARGSVEYVFAAAAVLLAGAGWLVVALPTRTAAGGTATAGALRHVGSGIAVVLRSRRTRLLVGLLGAEYVVVGALDLLFVVMAIDVLGLGPAWTGYFNTAYGVGGVFLGSLAVLLVGRRLGPVIVLTAVLLGVALGATAFASGSVAVVGLLTLVGGGRALFDVATRSLLQRAVPADMVARIFGLAEGLAMGGLAVGSLLAPALVAMGGGRFALAGVAAVLPLVVVFRGRLLLRLDQHAQVPIVEISLLRSLPLFHDLPAPALEGVARALERVDYASGTVMIKEGDDGDRYYAIADGHVEIRQQGLGIAVLGRGHGMGEIALLQGGRRTATAVATSPVTAYALDRESFLVAVNGHAPTRQTATAIAYTLQERDERRAAGHDVPDPE